MAFDDRTDAGRLYAANVVVDPPIDGAITVQDALDALGGASVFPVGPDDDGTRTIQISASSNELGMQAALDAGGVAEAIMHVAAGLFAAVMLVDDNAGGSPEIQLSATGGAASATVAIKTGGVDRFVVLADKIGMYGATPVVQPAAIAAPAGGGTVDTQARAAIVSILHVLGAAAGGVGVTQ